MECKNCKKPMQRVVKGHFYCSECGEVYKIEGDVQTQVKDKKEFFNNVLTEFASFGKNLKELAGKFLEQKKDDDDTEAGMFI